MGANQCHSWAWVDQKIAAGPRGREGLRGKGEKNGRRETERKRSEAKSDSVYSI